MECGRRLRPRSIASTSPKPPISSSSKRKRNGSPNASPGTPISKRRRPTPPTCGNSPTHKTAKCRIRFDETASAAAEATESPPFNVSDAPKAAVNMGAQILRQRLCEWQAAPILPNVKDNQRRLSDILENTIVQACNNSVLLLGPRGYGKSMVLDHVMSELRQKHPDRFSLVRLNGLLHADDRCALKEIATQLCLEHTLHFSKVASFNENLNFLTLILKEYSLSQKAIVFVLDEFDVFAQKSKQGLLYNLLNILQSSFTQAAIVGLSCRLDADQLLEKRVRSRFSQRRLLFIPPSTDELLRMLEILLLLPEDKCFIYGDYARSFNKRCAELLQQQTTKQLIKQLTDLELAPRDIVDLTMRSVCSWQSVNTGKIDFKSASNAMKQQPTLDTLTGLSVLELYLLTSMKRLEGRECDLYNFTTVFKEYKQLQESHSSCDFYTKHAALRAFEHLIERELVGYSDGRSDYNMCEIRAIKMVISSEELLEGLEASPVCPIILRQWFAHENFK